MPSGIYRRSPELMVQVRKNLDKGREPQAQQRARATLNKIMATPEWRRRVSEATRLALWTPDIRRRHLLGTERARKRHGINFRGGNGQPMTATVAEWAQRLTPVGFILEYAIKTRGQNTGERIPPSYKVDFGNPQTKTAIELDGPTHHHHLSQRLLDEKKTRVLETLGWKVIRIPHK